MPLPPGFIQALKASCEWEIIASVEGAGVFSRYSSRSGWFFPWFGDIRPILKNVSSIQHKLQISYAKTSVGKVEITLTDRSQWEETITGCYIKNRRLEIMTGPKGGNPADFYIFFTGLITDFSIRDDILTIEAQDDLYVTKEKAPEENETKTQYLAFQNQNPIDIKKTLLLTHAGIPAERLNSDQFDNERDKWYLGWLFERILTKPISIKNLISEIDEQTLNVTFCDGDKITVATFAPPLPGQTLLHIQDDWIRDSLAINGGMRENLFNNCVVYYDYNESGNDTEDDYDSIIIVADADSQSEDEWNEAARKEIKSKWIRSYTITQPGTNLTGVTVYHCNPENGVGDGEIYYHAANNSLTWAAPADWTYWEGHHPGPEVVVDRNGKYQLFSETMSRYIRVIVEIDSLPEADQSDVLTITKLPATTLAIILATHWITRYRDPQAELIFDIDLINAIHFDSFLKVSDVVKITSDQIITKGKPGWKEERLFLTAVRPDFERYRFKITGVQTSFKRNYGFIGSSTITSDYDGANAAEREYAFIADNNNKLGSKDDDCYYIW